MSRYVKSAFVGGLFLLASPLAAEQPEMVTDAEAYALYSLLAPPVWNRQTMGTDPILLQRETESPHTHGCAKVPQCGWIA